MSVRDEDFRDAVRLFYPLGLRYLSRAANDGKTEPSAHGEKCPIVRLYGVSPSVVRPEHMTSDKRSIRRGVDRVMMRFLQFDVPEYFNLYISIVAENEIENVQRTQRFIRTFVADRLLMNRKRKETASDSYGPNACIGGSSQQQSESTSSSKCSPFKTFGSTTAGRGAGGKRKDIAKEKSDLLTNLKLHLVFDDTTHGISSLYDFADSLARSYRYEDNGCEGLAKMDMQIDSKLYVCRFSDESLFHAVTEFLETNECNWKVVYRVPALRGQDYLRFSLDLYVRNKRLEEFARFQARRAKFSQMFGYRTNSCYEHLIEKSNVSSSLDQRAEVRLRQYLDDRCKRSGHSESEKNRGSFDHRVNGNSETLFQPGIDMYENFAFGEWCVMRKDTVVRIDRTMFEHLLLSDSDFLTVVERCPTIVSDVFCKPLTFVPSVIWDLETIAARPGTLPRGTSADEKIVSIAVTIDRHSVDEEKRCPSIVWVLVPEPLSEHERSSVEAMDLTSDGNLKGLDYRVDCEIHSYRDERAMLVDFCSAMVSQAPLLCTFFGIRPEFAHMYRDVVSFLVGHNSVGYDFQFIVDRSIFFGYTELTRHLTRRVRGDVRDQILMYTFHDAQLAIDTYLFLRARMRNLPSYDLGSVLRKYECELAKGDLDARDIRFFYNAIGDEARMRELRVDSNESRLQYYRKFLLYNLFDCVSIIGLLDKLAFAVYSDATVKYFRAPLNVACYSGNSKLLPSLFFADMLLHGKEVLCIRSRNTSMCAVETNAKRIADLFDQMKLVCDAISEQLESAGISIATKFYLHLFRGFDVSLCSADDLEENDNTRSRGRKRTDYDDNDVYDDSEDDDYEENEAFRASRVNERLPKHVRPSDREYHPAALCMMQYGRTVECSVKIDQSNASRPWRSADRSGRASRSNAKWKNLSDLTSTVAFERIVTEQIPFTENELDLLRVAEKTYIGGMNYAKSCHARNPILMDFNSFYPSIIRHFDLDFNNVAVFTVFKLLLLIGSLDMLRNLLQYRVIRMFDYTPEASASEFVNCEFYDDPRFEKLRSPSSNVPRRWYEGVEIDSIEHLVLSTKHFSRRVLIVWRKSNGSVLARIITRALEARAVLKQQRKKNPNDKVLESKENMAKVLANGTYGYLNFMMSVIFSRATAAAVTTLCRKTFVETCFIIEDPATLLAFNVELFESFYVVTRYVDTDGAVAVVLRKGGSNVTPIVLRVSIEDGTSFTVDCANFLTVNELPASKELTVNEYLDILGRRKADFVKLVNDRLGMQFVTLAPEENNAVAATIFGRKKYTLLKLCAPSAPLSGISQSAISVDGNATGLSGEARLHRTLARLFVLKKTGFEKNAQLPLKLMYERLLRNAMLLNHVFSLGTRDDFVAKILDHCSMLYSIFDTLYDMWRVAVHNSKRSKQGLNCSVSGKNELNLKSFASSIALNVRQCGGKVAEFIDKILREYQYDPGDRVKVLRVFDVSSRALQRTRSVRDFTNLRVVLYDTADSEFVLLDDAIDKIDDYVPDFLYFLGGHGTYMYQCVEGQQTLRDGKSDLVLRDSTSDDVMSMSKFRPLSNLFHATWFWDRILREKHVAAFGRDAVHYAISWKKDQLSNSFVERLSDTCHQMRLDTADKKLMDKAFPDFTINRAGGKSAIAPPHLLYNGRFERRWFARDVNERVELAKSVYFSEDSIDRERVDKFIRSKFIEFTETV